MSADRQDGAALNAVTELHPASVGLLLAPVGLAAVAVIVFVGGLAGWHPLWSQERPTLAEAIVLRDRGAAAYLLRQGADPNARYPVRAGALHSDARVLTPLEAAVAINSAEMLEYVQRFATVEAPERSSLGCLALRLRNQDLLPVLRLSADALDCDGVSYPW